MQWATDARAMLEPWLAYLDYCFNANPLAAICEKFWAWTILAVIATGALAVLAGVWKYGAYRRKLSKAERAREERMRIADEDTMRASMWDGDKAYQTELPATEVQRRIREAIEQRKKEAGVPETPR